jgi:hypothetical protein
MSNSTLEAANEALKRQLQDSIQVNVELLEKMAFMAELKQLDTLRGRLREIQEEHSPSSSPTNTSFSVSSVRASPMFLKSPAGQIQYAMTPKTCLSSYTPRDSLCTLKSTCWKSVRSDKGGRVSPLSAFQASDSPYPSPCESPSNLRKSLVN